MKYTYSYKHLLFFLCCVLLLFRFTIPPTNMLTWDVFGYYLYLPSYFIHHDIALQHQEWLTHLLDKYEPTSTLYQAIQIENGNWVMKYSMGMSFLYAPFFFVAHFMAEPLGFPADGLSLPYQFSITIGGLIYAIIGLIYFSKILKHFFDQRTTSIVLILIFFGTNYFQLTIFDGTLLSHNFLFMLYSILIYFTIKWYHDFHLKNSIIIGLIAGLITLVRPSEVICILIPLFWSNSSENYFTSKIKMLKTNILPIILASCCFLMLLLPQLLYWKSVSGHYLFYSYTNPGEGFDFFFPHTYNFLFSFRKGWFIYTPLILFSFLGMYYLYLKNKVLSLLIFSFVVLDIYICSSWSNWWYAGGSFSSRSLVPIYSILAIPLGFLIERIRLSKKRKRIIYPILGFLLLLNLFQTWQFENGIISKERMTKAYYFAIFGQIKKDQKNEKLLLVDRSVDGFEKLMNEKDYRSTIIYKNSFDTITDTKAFVLDEKKSFSPGPDLKYSQITKKDHAWIKISARIFIPKEYDEELPLMVSTFHQKGLTYKYFTNELKKDQLNFNAWNTIQFDYLTPEVRTTDDNLKVYVWHRGKKRILVDDMVINKYELK